MSNNTQTNIRWRLEVNTAVGRRRSISFNNSLYKLSAYNCVVLAQKLKQSDY